MAFRKALPKKGATVESKESPQEIALAALPKIFKDASTDEPLIANQLVVTPYGDCLNQSTIDRHWNIERGRGNHLTTCPVTARKLFKHMLITKGQLIEQLKSIFENVHHKIANLKSEDLET